MRNSKKSRLLLRICFPAALICSFAGAEITKDEVIDASFKAGFLSPGHQTSAPAPGREIEFSRLSLRSATQGTVTAHIWNVKSDLDFELSSDKESIKTLLFVVNPESPETTWDLCRHRHGYFLISGAGYHWSSLDDNAPTIDRTQGEFYDRYLKELWGYWIVKRLPRFVKTGKGEFEDSSNEAVFHRDIKIVFDENGLTKPVNIPFQINLWEMPVKISFEVTPSTAAVESKELRRLRCRYHWTYNRAEWRERHGYEQDTFGDYKFVKHWPGDRRLSEEQGKWLEELLDRCVTYWVDVSAQQLLSDLEKKVQTTVAASYR